MRPGRSSSTDCRASESPASCGAFHSSAASSAPSSSVPRSRGLNRTQSFGTGGEPSPARIRHQVDCGWAQTPANVSEVTAGARTSQTCAGEGQSHCGVSGRRAGGGDRADPVFHPSNGEMTQENQSPAIPVRFSRTRTHQAPEHLDRCRCCAAADRSGISRRDDIGGVPTVKAISDVRHSALELGCGAQALRHTTTERILDITSHSRMSKMSEVEPVSIGRFDVYVEPYFDLDAIGILNADISLGRGHSFGLA